MASQKDKVTLILGCASGMGAATLKMLLADGAKVVGFDNNEENMAETLEEIADEMPDHPGTLDMVYGDITSAEDRKRALDLVAEKYGKLDTLLYVVGVLDLMCPAHKTDDELWQYVMDVNCNDCFYTVRDALPMLLDHEGPAANVVIVGSVGGLYGSTAGAAYVTSKHAVLGLARNLAWSYHWRNLRVNVVNPGAIMTGILGNAMEKWPDRDVMDDEGNDLYNVRGGVALGVDAEGNNMMGDAEDIARAIGSPRSYRMVGSAVRKNPLAVIVPTHRVVNANGRITGSDADARLRIALLEFERHRA